MEMKDDTMMMNGDRDVEILNYALTLEYLEADFYTRIVDAQNKKSFLKPRVAEFANTLKRDETIHVAAVTDLIKKLGGTPVQMPTFQFPEEAFMVNVGFLRFAADLEATGVSAYLGQAPRVKRDDVLKAAASIYGNEARHVAIIRYMWGPQFSPEPLEQPMSMSEVLAKVGPLIASNPN